jgi:O-antigen ligase
VLTEALRVAGPIGALAPALAAMGLVLLRYPALAMALLLFSVGIVESNDPGILPTTEAFYNTISAGLAIPDLILLAGLGGVLLRFARTGDRPRLPAPLTTPLAILLLALLAGAVTAAAAHPPVSGKEIFHRSVYVLYLILVPLLVVNVVRDTKGLRIFAACAAGLAAYKGLSGIYAALGGSGEVVENQSVSYLGPLPNLVMLLYVLGVVAALVRRVRLPFWMLAASPLAVLALILSFRRSFWIAAVFAIVIVIIVASQRRGRAAIAIALVGIALALTASLTVGQSESSANGSPLLERAQSLSPGGVDSNRGDRYRIDERRNVIANLEEHPLTGVGVGVPWVVHYPLAESHDRRYAHVALLWFWLSFGPIGVIAYMAIMGGALLTAVDVWRRHPDAGVRIAAIACFGAVLALLVVELTATFAGINPRLSIALGAILGWLAAAWCDLPERGRKLASVIPS